MSGFRLHPEAYDHLDAIWEFIAQSRRRRSGEGNIYHAIQALIPFPHQGHRRTDLTSRPLRFWRVRDYLIAYAPDEKPLWVIAVMHGSRDTRVMAALLRSREE